MKDFKTFLKEDTGAVGSGKSNHETKNGVEVYYDEDSNRWSSQDLIKYGKENGYDIVKGIFGLKTAGNHDFVIFEPSDFDKVELKKQNVGLKNNENVYRYVSESSVIGGYIPFVKINFETGYAYFLTQESFNGDEDKIIFGTKGSKMSFYRVVKEKTNLHESFESMFLDAVQWSIFVGCIFVPLYLSLGDRDIKSAIKKAWNFLSRNSEYKKDVKIKNIIEKLKKNKDFVMSSKDIFYGKNSTENLNKMKDIMKQTLNDDEYSYIESLTDRVVKEANI